MKRASVSLYALEMRQELLCAIQNGPGAGPFIPGRWVENWYTRTGFQFFLFTGSESCATRIYYKNKAAPETF
jgi:hypothetical protein